jgi:hypothetical protein
MDDLLIDIEAESEEEAFEKAVDALSNMAEDDIIRRYTNNRKIKLSECFDDPKICDYRKAKHIAKSKPSWYEYLKRLKRHWKR